MRVRLANCFIKIAVTMNQKEKLAMLATKLLRGTLATVLAVTLGIDGCSDQSEPGLTLGGMAEGLWSLPRVISAGGESARAPNICVGPRDQVWVTWHSGTGDEMVVKLVRLAH